MQLLSAMSEWKCHPLQNDFFNLNSKRSQIRKYVDRYTKWYNNVSTYKEISQYKNQGMKPFRSFLIIILK